MSKIAEVNIKVIDLLPYLGDGIIIESMVGEWKAKINFKVKNWTKLLTE